MYAWRADSRGNGADLLPDGPQPQPGQVSSGVSAAAEPAKRPLDDAGVNAVLGLAELSPVHPAGKATNEKR